METDKAKHKHRKRHQSGSCDQLIINVNQDKGQDQELLDYCHVQKAIWEINYSCQRITFLNILNGPITLCLDHSAIFYWERGGGTENDQIYFKGDSSDSKMKEAFERGEVQARDHWGLSWENRSTKGLIQEICHDLVTVWP